MDEPIMRLIVEVVGSPWVYLALFGFATLDGFLPLVPSEHRHQRRGLRGER